MLVAGKVLLKFSLNNLFPVLSTILTAKRGLSSVFEISILQNQV